MRNKRSGVALAWVLGLLILMQQSPGLVAQEMGPPDANPVDAEDGDQDSSNYEQCQKYRADPDADLGDVLRAGCEPTLAQMSALMDNPLGNVAMMFNQVDAYKMEEPISGHTENQFNYMMLFQFPKKLNDNWNLINRVVLNVPSMPLDQGKIDDFLDGDVSLGPGENPAIPPDQPFLPVQLFDGRETGFGDTYYVALFAPSEPITLSNGAKLLLGGGFDIGMDTASENVLGTGKWSAGPSALAVYMGEKFKAGALVQHYWDFAGDDDRDDVNMTNIQYLYYWSLDDVTSIGAGPNFLINWEQDKDNRYTLPVGIGINRTFQFGKIPVRMGFEYFKTVVSPDAVPASDWSVRFYIIPAAPSALFGWMQ
ncbi:MAG: hypothetical protein V7709_13790 [Halioglobus sp.]